MKLPSGVAAEIAAGVARGHAIGTPPRRAIRRFTPSVAAIRDPSDLVRLSRRLALRTPHGWHVPRDPICAVPISGPARYQVAGRLERN